MIKDDYKKQNRVKCFMILGLLAFTLMLAYYFTTFRMENVGINQTVIALQKAFSGTLEAGANVATNKIILLLRMPRIIMAILAGIGLAISGAVMQSVTRNYLVSPFTLGISSAAAFGASVCIVFAPTAFFASNVGMITGAFLASVFCGAVVYGVSQRMGVRPATIVLVGIGMNYLFSAMTATIEFFADEYKLDAVIQWTFGSFNKADWNSVMIVAAVTAVGFCMIMRYCLQLDAIAANDDEMVQTLGINPARLRTINGILAIFITSTIISFTGVIGFVGLIAPHMARFIIGGNHRFYMPFAAVMGAFLLLVSDFVGKNILYPVNIPVGIIISFLGVPVFIHLIMSNKKSI